MTVKVSGGAARRMAASPGDGLPTPHRRGHGGEWMEDALCRRFVAEIWELADESLKARHLCVRHCPVVDECRAWARQHRWHECVVGGERWQPRGDSPAARPVSGDSRLARMVRHDCLLCETPEPWHTPSSRPLPRYPFRTLSLIPRTHAGVPSS